MRFWSFTEITIVENQELGLIAAKANDKTSLEIVHKESGMWLILDVWDAPWSDIELAASVIQHYEPTASWYEGVPMIEMLSTAGIPQQTQEATDFDPSADELLRLEEIAEEVRLRRAEKAAAQESLPSP